MRTTQFKSSANCPTEINLVDKDGTSNVFFKHNDWVNFTSPVPMTGEDTPFAFKIFFRLGSLIFYKSSLEYVMWSVAPESITHLLKFEIWRVQKALPSFLFELPIPSRWVARVREARPGEDTVPDTGAAGMLFCPKESWPELPAWFVAAARYSRVLSSQLGEHTRLVPFDYHLLSYLSPLLLTSN